MNFTNDETTKNKLKYAIVIGLDYVTDKDKKLKGCINDTVLIIKLIIDDEETIAQYNEPIEFYTWDRQPLDVFLKLSNTVGSNESVEILKSLILDRDGNPVITEGQSLPVLISVKAMAKVMELLGK